MADIVQTLKTHARKLHRLAGAGDPAALQRLRKLVEFRVAETAAMVAPIRRRHCLAVIARELGFRGWPHAVRVLSGLEKNDFGTLLYPHRCGAHINIWCASYDEAKQIRANHGGILLAYKHEYLVVDDDYMTTLGVDPSDPDVAHPVPWTQVCLTRRA